MRATGELLEDMEAFFQKIDSRSYFARGGREFRVREPGIVPDAIGPSLEHLYGLVSEASLKIEDDITRSELGDLGRRLLAAREGITVFIDQVATNHVYWVERTGKTESNLSLHAAPIDLSEILSELIFRPNRSVVMTSATLSVGNSEMGYFRQRVGATGPGIDAAQSNVIITQLPFAPPDSPATEARCELIRERGGDPFSEYSLPEAILKLRQGVGRLIRTKGDRGIVAILDSRVVKKPYGRAFLNALPKCPVAKVE